MNSPHAPRTELRQRPPLCARTVRLLCIALLTASTGCSALYSPHSGTIEHKLEVLQRLPRSNMQPIDPRLLGQTPPPEHLVTDGDILGIYIEGALGANDTDVPVRFPGDRAVSPAIGYPTPVRNGGFIRVPQIGVMHVRGMTAWQIEERIRHILTVEKQVIRPDEALIHVSVMWKRGVNVMVIRQEEFGTAELVSVTNDFDSDRRSGQVVQLPMFRNDVMNALLESGGFPNDEAENAVYVFKRRDRQVPGQPQPLIPTPHTPNTFPTSRSVQQAAYSSVSGEPPGTGQTVATTLQSAAQNQLQPAPRTHAAVGHSIRPVSHVQSVFADTPHCSTCDPSSKHPGAVRIPLSVNPGEHLPFSQQDVILEDGDIILVESRENETFLTAGLLGGGQYVMPRNYDIDVIDAVLLADSFTRGSQFNNPTRAIGGASVLNRDVTIGASRVVIERKSPDGQIQRFRVNLYTAMRDPTQRVLIEPGDRLFLEYTPIEAFLAFLERQVFDPFLFGVPTVIAN